MPSLTANEFIFLPRYRAWRHLVYWCLYLLIWSCYWTMVGYTFKQNVLKMIIWLPVFMVYSYPVAYYLVPKLLLKGHYITFIASILAWGVMGWYFNIFIRGHYYFPMADWLLVPHDPEVRSVGSFLCMTTTTGSMTISAITKRWVIKQQQLLQSEKEKTTAQLQVLQAQLHPHFLFNTLNNIYAFSLYGSPKTPQLIVQLSSLLSYVLYDCKAELVPLEKEIEIMKDYMALEKERYGDKIDISVNIEGEIAGKNITPLLMLPFLENAFKHGTSEQLDKPWMSVDISVKDSMLRCKVVNSKNEYVPFSKAGVGIANTQLRLTYLYPQQHELKLSDEGDFFVVSLLLHLKEETATVVHINPPLQQHKLHANEAALFIDRR